MTSLPMPAPDYGAPAPTVAGHEAVFTIPSFAFESGEELSSLEVGYVTHGALNAARDNCIIVFPGTANTRHSADGYIGAGNALDPSRDFIVAVDAIGAGTSSTPRDGLGGRFPRYGIRDMVRAVHRLVQEVVRVSRVKAVVGASMGAFQALEWAVHFPDAAERAILLVPAARAGRIFQSAVELMLEIIALDPDWRGGEYVDPPVAGLRATGRMYFPWTVSDAYMERVPASTLEREMRTTIERAAAWDAWTLIRRYQASSAHDVAAPFGGDLARALGQVTARTLVMPTTTDRLLGIDGARAIARHVPRADYVEVPSERGHLGWRAVPGAPESRIITEHIVRFLSSRI